MIVVTSPTVPGKTIIRTIGLVSGNTIRARHVGKDILAGLRNLVGGEITEYAKLLAESREQAVDRMMAQAERLDANAIVSMQLSTSVIMGGAGGDDGLRNRGYCRRQSIVIESASQPHFDRGVD